MEDSGLFLDVGCGVGIDSLAAQRRGWAIVGIEKDPVTAVFAGANLRLFSRDGTGDGEDAQVINAALEDVDLSKWLADPRVALFLDPARRTSTHRSWDVADLSPSWDSVLSLVDRGAGKLTTIKVGPGFPHALIPQGADVTWVSHRGDLVETTLWFPGKGRRTAVILGKTMTENMDPATSLRYAQDDERSGHNENGQIAELAATELDVTAGPLGEYLYEPDPAVTRAHATGDLCRLLGAHRVADSIAYLTSTALTVTPFAEAFHIDEVMDYSEKILHKWVKAQGIGILEIKTRGLRVDPAILRRTLKPTGNNAATLILTPTIAGTKALVVSRIPA